MMEQSVKTFFERYEKSFRNALRDGADMDEAASHYASEFIAASPAGVTTGKNDDYLKQVMAQGYARHRAIGTKEMRIRDIRISPLDEHHCVAHVAWTATYARDGRPDIPVDFEVHYLLQQLEEEPKIFGWVSGDEQELLKQHGIV